ncbi:MAG: hypothetical protein WKF96_13620 [Solirubrobacteraceae bacterium]
MAAGAFVSACGSDALNRRPALERFSYGVGWSRYSVDRTNRKLSILYELSRSTPLLAARIEETEDTVTVTLRMQVATRRRSDGSRETFANRDARPGCVSLALQKPLDDRRVVVGGVRPPPPPPVRGSLRAGLGLTAEEARLVKLRCRRAPSS